MKSQLNTLIVEDRQEQIDTWNIALNSFNRTEEEEFSIKPFYAKSAEDAFCLIRETKLDVAVVDLRLGKDYNAEGNEVLKFLVNSETAVSYVFSGAPQEEAEISDKPNIKFIRRDSGVKAVIDEIKNNISMIKCLKSAKSIIERKVAAHFDKSIWPRWDKWSEFENSKIAPSLARHLAANIHESLVMDYDGSILPEENYFIPPHTTDKVETGNLYKREKDIFVVLTPRCDLYRHEKKLKGPVLLAKCEDISSQWKDALQKPGKNGNYGELYELIKNKLESNHHLHEFTVGNKTYGPFSVNFHALETEVFEILQKQGSKWELLATLTPHVLPSLVQRFGACYSRIGAPEFDLSMYRSGAVDVEAVPLVKF